MIIYQIISSIANENKDNYYVQGTYLHKCKAEKVLTQLTNEVNRCLNCPYRNRYLTSPLETDCTEHTPFNVGDYGDEYGYSCRNSIDSYDAPTYYIKEYKIDESEE